MKRLLEAIWRLALLVEVSLYLNGQAAGHRPAHRSGPGRHRHTTASPYTAADTLFLAWLADQFAALGAGTVVAA